MGQSFLDTYSLLHYATGVVAYYWGVGFYTFGVAHVVFELLENSSPGMAVIRAFPFWPGGKSRADSVLNMVGDTVFGLLGHWSASLWALATA